MTFPYKIFVEEEQAGIRIDKLISNTIEELSRTYIQKLISQGFITVNGSAVTSKYMVQIDDQIDIFEPETLDANIVAEDIPLEILYQDEDVLVVNKPRGMVVHPAAGHSSGTLVNALMAHSDSLSSISGTLRPGIVHRIDKDTSGLLMVAKTDKAHHALAEQLKEKSNTRIYYGLVDGVVQHDKGLIDAPIGRDPKDRKKMAVNDKNGKDAITHFEVLERFAKYTLVKCQLETGRTHQIRVHMKYIGHPIVGDYVYGKSKNEFGLTGQFLHAETLGFIHPTTHEYMEFSAPMPMVLTEILTQLRTEGGKDK